MDKLQQGNYVLTAIKPTVVSALGAIPKPKFTEVRLIHDCSRPQGKAVNYFISTRSFKFQSLDDAIKLLIYIIHEVFRIMKRVTGVKQKQQSQRLSIVLPFVFCKQ